MARKKKTTAVPSRPDRNVSLKKVENGFVISTYADQGERTRIAKTAKEAQRIAVRMLGSSK